MEGTRTSLWMLLLLSQLPLCPADADPNPLTERPHSYQTSGWTTTGRSDHADANGTGAACLIDTEMGLIAVGSAGALIVCLLASTAVLACQICVIQRRAGAPRTSRSNVDLVSGAGYWGVADGPEASGGLGGLVGPCDAGVMLEEVRADGEPEAEGPAEGPEAGEEPGLIQTSSSRDSFLEIPRDLEDMPLVV